MGKIVDGVELLRMLKNKEIKDFTKIYVEPSFSTAYRFYIMKGIYIQIHMYREDIKGIEKDVEIRALDTNDLLNKNFVLPEEDEEIDIQSIKGIDINLDFNNVEKWEDEMQIASKIDELLKAIKQLDKKIKEKE